MVGPLRSGGDYTALGDAVNIAQRLQVAAPPGGVLVGPATHAATESVIQYEAMGGLHARGREELVDAWLAVEPVVPPGMRPRRLRAPLVGRAAERQLLLDGLKLAVTHHRAFHAQIEGEGGVGKSRLAEELLAEAKAEFGSLVLLSGNKPFETEVASVRVLTFIENGSNASAASVASLMLFVALVVIVGLDIVQRAVARRG